MYLLIFVPSKVLSKEESLPKAMGLITKKLGNFDGEITGDLAKEYPIVTERKGKLVLDFGDYHFCLIFIC